MDMHSNATSAWSNFLGTFGLESSERHSKSYQSGAPGSHRIASNQSNTSNPESSSRSPPIIAPDPAVHSDTVQCYRTDEFSSKALQNAVSTGNIRRVRLLVHSGSNSADTHRALLLASRIGNRRIVDSILAMMQPHKMNYVDEFGYSPLYYAINDDSPEMVASLLGHGANTHEVDHDGHSPLSHALHRGYERCVRELLVHSETRAPSHELAFGNQMVFHPEKKLVVEFQWELPRVIEEVRKEFPDKDLMNAMHNLVTVIGSGQNYDCCTCREYLSKTWPSFGISLFTILVEGMISAEDIHENQTLLVDMEEIHLWRATTDNLILLLPAGCEGKLDICKAICWMCAAIRPNPQRLAQPECRSLQLSKALKGVWIGREEGDLAVTSFALEPLENFQVDLMSLNGGCWAKLFDTAVVVEYPIRRSWGRGLEMSFDMMIHLAAVENFYCLDPGIILLGYFTAIVPIEQQHGGQSIQWHLEFVDDMDDCLDVSHLTSIKGEWFKTDDKSLLQQSKCFLGWSEFANIALGTQALCEQHKLRASYNTSERRQVARVEGFEAGVQAGFTLGPILSLAPKVTSSWVFHSTVQHFSAASSYMQAINLSRGKVALVLDSKTKQAWLVPFLSLALHLCQRYWQEFEDIALSPIPFASLESDGAKAAFSALRGNGSLHISGTGAEAETLSSLFLRINSNLLQTARTRAASRRGCVFASELLDIIMEPGRGSPLKKIHVPETTRAWLPLVEKVDCVGVCADLGLAIQPAESQASTCGCYVLPKDKFYLAAHMRCLDQLAQTSGGNIDYIAQGKCKLGEGLLWKNESLPWVSCMVGNKHVSVWGEGYEARILQQVYESQSDNELRELLDNPSNGSIMKEGVVVFGDEEHPKLLEGFMAALVETIVKIRAGNDWLFQRLRHQLGIS